MKTTFALSKFVGLIYPKSFSWVAVMAFLFFTSCDKKTTEVALEEQIPTFSVAPENTAQVLQQTLLMYNYKIPSQYNVFTTFMQGFSMVKDPNAQQSYELINKHSLIQQFFAYNKNARASFENRLNIDEVSKMINSENVSKHTRKHILAFSKGLDKIKQESSSKNYDADSEILKAIDQLEKSVGKDSDLREDEKAVFVGITTTLKKSYQDIKRSAEKSLASGKTSCWVCSLFNAVVTVIVVAVVVAVAFVAAIATVTLIATGVGITAAAVLSFAIGGAAIGTLIGITSTATGNCFLVWDYGQFTPGSWYGFLGLQLGTC